MIHSIRFHGLSLAKDEQAVQNGELSLCANVELHDGALRPSVLTGTEMPTTLTAHAKDWDESADDARSVVRLVYVHKTSSYTHFIGTVKTDDGETYFMYWYREDGSLGGLVKSFAFMPTAIDSVGNTLVIVSEAGIEYALWKNTKDEYKYLGTKPPFLELQFGLGQNNFANYETGGVDVEGSADGFSEAWQMTNYTCEESISRIPKYSQFEEGEKQVNFKEKAQADFTENIWALINRTNDLIAKEGHFYANFFVRYCYRLYDGSMVMHSAPVFMPVLVPDNYVVAIPNLATDPGTTTSVWADSEAEGTHNWQVYWENKVTIHRQDSKGADCAFTVSKVTFQYMPRNVALQFLCNSSTAVINELKEWADIVESVDIFVTPPLTAVDETQTVKSASRCPAEYTTSGGAALRWKPSWVMNENYPIETVVDIPALSHDAYADKIRETAAFFKIASIKTADIQPVTELKDLEIDKQKVYYVASQEQMKDDYKTHNFIFPKGMYVYNHRINVFGLHEQLFHGFTPSQMFFHDARLNCSESEKYDVMTVKAVYVRLRTDEGEKYVKVDDPGEWYVQPYVLFNLPVFYPDARADKMYFIGNRVTGTGSGTFVNKCAEIDLTPCDELNGAMHVRGFTSGYDFADAPAINVDDTVQMPNRIYTSEQDNPYYFPVEGINSVGTGEIIGLAATTRALSQGQFGQFPLMAFTTNGIWALSVASSGTYSAIHPISREVCVNADSICQLDQSVVFATDRALNKVAESSVASFSGILDGPFFNIASALKQLDDYFKDDAGIATLIGFATPPIEYFKKGVVINDFVNSRIIVFPSGYYAPSQSDNGGTIVILVYSIRDSAWSTMLVDRPLAVLNSYPYPYIERQDGTVLTLDKKYDYTDTAMHKGLVVTRALTFGQAMTAIAGFDQQTDSQAKAVVFFFGSNDNRTWHYIGHSAKMHCSYLPGHSFRFFRIAVYTRMTCAEKYFQLNINTTDKYQKL